FDLGNGPASDNILLTRYGISNDLAFFVFNGGSQVGLVVAPGAIELNKWQHFTVTMTAAGAVTLYKNGAVIATGSVGLPRVIERTSNYLGKSNWPDALYQGSLDEAAFYGTALSAQQVAAHQAATHFGSVDIDLLQQGNPTPVA